MLIVADEHIPLDVINFLRERGHEVVASRDVVGSGAPDPDIANWASANRAIVLSRDRWFKQNIRRYAVGKTLRFPQSGRILIGQRVPEARMAGRLAEQIERIEREFDIQQGLNDPRLIVEITWRQIIIES